MFNRVATKALAAGLLMALTTTLAAQLSGKEAGILNQHSPICPNEQDLRDVWGHLYAGEIDAALAMMAECDCQMPGEHWYYQVVDEGRIDDHVAKVARAPASSGQPVGRKVYTAPGGMRCLLNCPPDTDGRD